MRGQRVCHAHGGRAKQNKRKAERTLAIAKVQRMIDLAGMDMDPIAHALDCLYRAHAVMLFWGNEAAELSGDQLYTVNKLGDRKPHPSAVEYQAAMERRMKFAETCSRMGVTERQMALAERLGEQLAMLWEHTMAAVPDLSPAVRQALATAYAAAIDRLERPAIDGTARDVA